MSTNSTLKIRCSELETLRNDVQLFVDNLTSTNPKTGGGSHGMFACWKDVARYIHMREINLTEGIEALKEKFERFEDTEYNRTKQAQLIKQLEAHYGAFVNSSYEFVEGIKHMKWQITDKVKLTGHTPWIFKKEGRFDAILFSESEMDWRNELRFPLFQQYIAENIMECDSGNVSVGIFNVSNNTFDLNNYTKDELTVTVQTTKELFEDLYYKYKKATTPYTRRSISVPIQPSNRPVTRP